MYHRKVKEEELDALIPNLRHAIQPFLEGLLDSGKTILQYCAYNDRHGWRRLFLEDDKFASYSEVFLNLPTALKLLYPQSLEYSSTRHEQVLYARVASSSCPSFW